MINQNCDIAPSKITALKDSILVNLIAYLRDTRKADADIIEDDSLRDALRSLIQSLESKVYLSINSSNECSGAKDAFTLMSDSKTSREFNSRVKDVLSTNEQLINEWLITHLYLSPMPNVDWFIDEGLAFTIFQDAIVVRTIIDSSYNPTMSDLLDLLNQSLILSKQFIDYAIDTKLVNPLTPGLEATALPEVRSYLKRLVAYPMFRNQEVSNLTNIDTLYKDLKLPDNLEAQKAKMQKEMAAKDKTIAYLSLATVVLGLGCAYLVLKKSSSQHRIRTQTSEPIDKMPRHYARTDIPTFKG